VDGDLFFEQPARILAFGQSGSGGRDALLRGLETRVQGPEAIGLLRKAAASVVCG